MRPVLGMYDCGMPSFPGPRNRKLSVLSLDKLWESGVAVQVGVEVLYFSMPYGSFEFVCMLYSSMRVGYVVCISSPSCIISDTMPPMAKSILSERWNPLLT